jgi:anti-anti-sigma factor
MEIKVRIDNKTAYLIINGEINSKATSQLSECFKEIMGNVSIYNVNLNLKKVVNISSAGIGKILKLFKYLNNKGGSMKVQGISKELCKLFKEIHLDKIMPIEI